MRKAVRPRASGDPELFFWIPVLAGMSGAHRGRLHPVAQAANTFFLGAVLATEERAFLFEPVADYVNAAMPASWSECVDRTFEAVKGVRSAVHDHLKGLVVIVSAGFASCHKGLPFAVGQPASMGRVPQMLHGLP